MSTLVITPRGKAVVKALVLTAILAVSITGVVAAFLYGENARCTWLVEHDRILIAEQECPASYLP